MPGISSAEISVETYERPDLLPDDAAAKHAEIIASGDRSNLL